MIPALVEGVDPMTNTSKMYSYLIICQCLNYTPFLATLILYPLICIPARYLELMKNVEEEVNPYTKEPLKENTSYFSQMLVSYSMIVSFVILMHYLVQKNLLHMSMSKNITVR